MSLLAKLTGEADVYENITALLRRLRLERLIRGSLGTEEIAGRMLQLRSLRLPGASGVLTFLVEM